MKICLKTVSLFARNFGGFCRENIWQKHNLTAPNPVLSRFFRHFMAGASTSQNSTQLNETPFTPKKALILTKFSRYEFEKRTHSDLSEDELIKNLHFQLEDRGSDYNNLLQHHQIHMKNRELVVKTLQDHGIETKVVNRFEYSDSNIDWADVIFTTGGDGTFLMAASKIKNRDKPLIGINSDPTRSLGHLCLPSFYTENFPEAVNRLKAGNFKWMHRQRIKISLSGENAFDPPIELHDQQLQYPEYRFLDCVEGHHKSNSPKVPKLDKCTKPKCLHELPVRALNEVFIGECLSSRVSYYELSINSAPKEKLKSSGLTVCTGTGSTSWSFNINKVTEQCVKHLLKITSEETKIEIPVSNKTLITQITNKFNNSLIFDPTKLLMAYTLRDPIMFGMGFKCKPRGFAERIEIKSRMFDACLVIDGGLSFAFNDGATAVLEISDEDALLTITLPD
ncbi:NAD kinase 2 like protein [Argiope bruennichi]|uniref:NAD kinase 2, mitochondrial n=1 Tax=Argiope bruennichi TaxID=94029 RepID=A0A8T0EX84_ARGBR|nr:NAD kinase 2 like protein [Argiope bruennichi]